MRFSVLAIAFAIAAAAMAAPMSLAKRDTASDINILNYALTLEHLEAEFYNQGLAKYSEADFKKAGFDTKIWGRFNHIKEHEATHVTVLTSVISALKGSPVPVCKYEFPLDNLNSFLAVAQALENTGTSAYLGAASGLSGDLLTAAATITTVEARHSAFLNELWGQSGIPYTFDTPLNPKEIVTIASNFIASCPYDLGVMPFTQLTATLPAKGGSKVKTSFAGEQSGVDTWCQFLYDNKVGVSPRDQCALPKDAEGYVYVVITDSETPITLKDDTHIVAGPALLFHGNHGSK
ncbi:hypothetical protein BGZ93_004040 [Podila epicladia]|nr:hypothetical protein BGZ92_006083 [Podila epicladia]KAG0096744.1 hypothetical protein BGZ93_004040 [Podila epicladia]